MSDLWPHWLRLGWLVLVPLLIWLSWQLWQRPQRSGRWQALIPARFHAALLIGGEQRSNRLPWLALTLGWLLALLALLGPSWQQVEEHPFKSADPLVVVLDLSAEMLAADTPPSRLEQARRKLLDLLQARGDAQTAIVVYAGSAHSLVPLSDDLLTSRNLLESLKPSIMPVPGRRADLGVEKALQLLQQGANGKGRILLISAQLDSNEQAAISQLLKNADKSLDILGVGTLEGAPILQADGSFLKDANGGILLPHLDEGSLQNFASSSGGQYSRLRLDNLDLDHLQLLERTQDTRQASEPTRLQLWADAGHWLLLPLLLLAACAGRRGWLLCLPLLLVLPRPVYAFDFIDLWLTPDQQGARLLQQNQPAAAAEQFADPQWQGIAHYQAGDYDAAASLFNQGDRAIDHYNRGDALAKHGDLEAALDAYETALERQPDMPQANQNKALVEQLLRQQKEQQKDQQQNQQQSGDGQSKQDQQQSGQQSGQPSSQPQDAQQGQGQQQQQNKQGDQSSNTGQAQSADKTSPESSAKPSEPASADTSASQAQTEQQQPAKSPENASQTAANAADEPLTANTEQRREQSASAGQNPAGQAQSADRADNEQAQGMAGESSEPLDAESRQALEQWLRQIPDDPSELLRRKFWYEQQQRQENAP